VLIHDGRVVAVGPPADVLRPEVLSTFYGVDVDVRTHDDGTITVHPRRSARGS
jgi:ABC-type hemin transport system ATPase subunit